MCLLKDFTGRISKAIAFPQYEAPIAISFLACGLCTLCYLTLLLQIATGKGALGQLQLELNLPSYAVDLLILGILGYSLAGAFNPATYSEENQRDVKKRNPGVHHSVFAIC